MRAPRLSIGLGSFLVALALGVAVGISAAIGAIPSDGTYSACLTKATGEIRVINYPKVKCVKGERLIRWSQQGPAGPQGPQGAQGPAGASDWNAIPNKPAGFADAVDDGMIRVMLTTVQNQGTVAIPVGEVGDLAVPCPAGKVVAGGFGQGASNLRITDSYPQDNGWIIGFKKMEAGNPTVRVYAICMTTEPTTAITTAKKAGQPAKLHKKRR